MNRGSALLLIFFAGAGVGAAASWKLLEKKYRDISDEEIRSVKEYYERKEAERSDAIKGIDISVSDDKTGNDHLIPKDEEKESLGKTYKKLISERGYRDYSGGGRHEKEEEKAGKEDVGKNDSGICMIAQDEFGEDEDYDRIEFTYYEKDDIVVNEDNEEVTDREELIGDAIQRLLEGDETVVYVKNDILKCYFEILLSISSYDPNIRRSGYAD